jgi:hypothetical protein
MSPLPELLRPASGLMCYRLTAIDRRVDSILTNRWAGAGFALRELGNLYSAVDLSLIRREVDNSQARRDAIAHTWWAYI